MATNDAYTVYAGTTFSNATPGVLGNDTNTGGGTLSAVLRTGPANASAWKFNADGTFSYTPKAGFSGTDSFTYKASNGTATSLYATVTLTVLPPVANNDAYAVSGGNTLTVDAAHGVLVNDTNGSGITAVLRTGPANASAWKLNADGSFSYTPKAGFTGTDSFTYRAAAGTVVSTNYATVTITVD